MIDQKNIDALRSEVESRLDDIFGKNDVDLPDSQIRGSTNNYPLEDLRNLILSIDWEITDEVLENLLQQLEDLKLEYQNDMIVLAFLQILNSLGDYIKMNRGESHPKTFKILNSVFSSLEKVVLSSDMTEIDKKKILRTEMSRYKELRAQIAKRKITRQHKVETTHTKAENSGKQKKEEASETTASEPTLQDSDSVVEEISTTDQRQEMDTLSLAEAVREIKQYVHAEIKALREEIKSYGGQK